MSFQAALLHPGKSPSCWLALFYFFSLPHKDVLLKHQHCLSLLLISPSNDYLAPPEVVIFADGMVWGRVGKASGGGNSSLTRELGCSTKSWPHQSRTIHFLFLELSSDPPSAEICQCVFPGYLANNNLIDSMVFIDSPKGVLWRLQNWSHKQPTKIVPPTSVWTLPFPKWLPPALMQHGWLRSIF